MRSFPHILPCPFPPPLWLLLIDKNNQEVATAVVIKVLRYLKSPLGVHLIQCGEKKKDLNSYIDLHADFTGN